MNEQIKYELSKIEIPEELHQRSKSGIHKAKSEMGGKLNRLVKKRIATILIAASLAVPTGALAYQSLLADDLYGSFENLQKHMVNITKESYLLFDAKLNQVTGVLGKGEFEQFKGLLSVLTSAKLEFGDRNGNIDYTLVPPAQLEEIKGTLYDIQPYFDKLNDLPSSKELLTTSEYKQYIQALMVYETIMAQLGVSSPPDIASVPDESKKEFTEAKKFLDFVNDKQIDH